MDDSGELTLSVIRAVAKRASQCSSSLDTFEQFSSPGLSATDAYPAVVDRLYDAQKRYDQNRNERQYEAAEAAKLEIRSGPVINARSARLASANAPIEVRSEHLRQKRERILECQRQLVRERTEAAVTGTPSIHPRSQRLHRTVADLMHWEDRKQKRRSLQQHRQMEQRLRTCTFRPMVRASSLDNRWTRSHCPGKSSVGSTPTSTTSCLSSEPLSFQAFQERLNAPAAAASARCRSAGSHWIKGGDFSSVRCPRDGSQDSTGNSSSVHIEFASGGEEAASEMGNAKSSHHSSQGSSWHCGSSTVSSSSSPVGRSKGFGSALRSQKSGSRSGYPVVPSTPTRAQFSGGGGTCSAGSIPSPRGAAQCNVTEVEYSYNLEAVLAIARQGGG